MSELAGKGLRAEGSCGREVGACFEVSVVDVLMVDGSGRGTPCLKHGLRSYSSGVFALVDAILSLLI